MRLHRIYYPFNGELGGSVSITDDKAHYLRNVLRLKPDQIIILFNHKQQEFLAKTLNIKKNEIELIIVEKKTPIAPSKLDITIIQGLSKGERMDYTIQKATELGAMKVVPLISEYCDVKIKGARLDKKLKHWKNIAISASEQSFRADIPVISTPITIAQYAQEKRLGLFLEPNEKMTLNQIAKQKWPCFDIAIGPEGGWSTHDLQLLKLSGLIGIQFGQRILRTETVTPAILAAIHSHWGDFI